MSFKPDEMAEQGHQKTKQWRNGQPDRIGKCASDSKKEKKWRNGRLVAGQAGPLFFQPPFAPLGPGPGCRVSCFLSGGRTSKNRQVSYQLRTFYVCEIVMLPLMPRLFTFQRAVVSQRQGFQVHRRAAGCPQQSS